MLNESKLLKISKIQIMLLLEIQYKYMLKCNHKLILNKDTYFLQDNFLFLEYFSLKHKY